MNAQRCILLEKFLGFEEPLGKVVEGMKMYRLPTWCPCKALIIYTKFFLFFLSNQYHFAIQSRPYNKDITSKYIIRLMSLDWSQWNFFLVTRFCYMYFVILDVTFYYLIHFLHVSALTVYNNFHFACFFFICALYFVSFFSTFSP